MKKLEEDVCMKVAIASDHGSIHIREEIKNLLNELQIPFEDFGCECSTSVDYPDYALPVAEKWHGVSSIEAF